MYRCKRTKNSTMNSQLRNEHRFFLQAVPYQMPLLFTLPASRDRQPETEVLLRKVVQVIYLSRRKIPHTIQPMTSLLMKTTTMYGSSLPELNLAKDQIWATVVTRLRRKSMAGKNSRSGKLWKTRAPSASTPSHYLLLPLPQIYPWLHPKCFPSTIVTFCRKPIPT